MPHVLVVGPVSWNVLVHLDDLPDAVPQTLLARRYHETVGGTSAGKALNLRRLGIDVTLSTVVADDEAGARVLARLRAAGVDVQARPAAAGTERHVNLMDAAGRRVSVYLELSRERDDGGTARPEGPPGLRSALATADAVVVDLADHSRPVLRAALAAGRDVWCDLHDYDGVNPFHEEFAAAARHVVASHERLPDPVRFVRERVDAGAHLAVCTLGADGAVALERGGRVERVAAEPADVVDTNGAGDAFLAGFLAAHLAGRPLAERLRAGARAAAACVASPDLVGLPAAQG